MHRDIASRIASSIPDGATIQTGIGALEQAVLEFLLDHKDLRIHSELIADSVIDLIEAGVINNDRKALHRHRAVSGFALGTRRLFDFIDNNPIFEFRPTSYTNDPFVQNDHMGAVNLAIEVDITGQVSSDSVGGCRTAALEARLIPCAAQRARKAACPLLRCPLRSKAAPRRASGDFAAGGRCGYLAGRCALGDYRVRLGLPPRQEPPAARRSADRGGRSPFPR